MHRTFMPTKSRAQLHVWETPRLAQSIYIQEDLQRVTPFSLSSSPPDNLLTADY